MNEPTYDQLKAVFDAAGTPPDAEGDEWPTPLVDWVEAYGARDNPAHWLAEPLIPAGGAVAIFAKGGTGKSLLALWLAANLTTTVDPCEILYLDYEMTLDTVIERLEDMGHADPHTLKRLHYASLPTLPPLNTHEGGQKVLRMAKGLGVALVVIDTFGRAVNGEEDKADTVQAWYRWTGQLLKTAGIAFLRIDHAGKDLKRGQRGTSAKNDDVDVVWEMTDRGHGEYLLRTTKRRVSWVPERVVVRQTNHNGILAYHWESDMTNAAADVALLLDDLGAPVDISRREAMVLLRNAGCGRNNNTVGAALRYRQEVVPELSGTTPRETGGTGPAQNPTSPQVVPPGYQPVPPPQPSGTGGWDYIDSPTGSRPIPGLFDDITEEDT